MSMVDPVSDLFTRIRNAKDQKFATIELPSSRFKMEILKLMKNEGYIRNFVMRKRKGHSVLKVYLKYTQDGDPAFDHIESVSTPGRRVYVDKKNIPVIAGGMGTAIISTSNGLMASNEAKKRGIGGEVICRIW